MLQLHKKNAVGTGALQVRHDNPVSSWANDIMDVGAVTLNVRSMDHWGIINSSR